jgi:hypothetical protein
MNRYRNKALLIVFIVWTAAAFILTACGSQTPAPIESASDVPRVSLADAKTAYDRGSAVFVDVRREDSFLESHIPGALSIPLVQIPQRISELDPESWIITYCT